MSTQENERLLARKLATLEGELSGLEKTRDAMMSVRSLVATALHDGNEAHRATKANGFYDPTGVYQDGYIILEALAERACSEIVKAGSVFLKATKDDPVVGAELADIHTSTPLGQLWSGEEYPTA